MIVKPIEIPVMTAWRLATMLTRQAYVRSISMFIHTIGISARDTSDPSKRPVPVPWDTFMQAVDVAKDVAAEREPAHHGLLLALGDWRPDWCIQNQRRDPTL